MASPTWISRVFATVGAAAAVFVSGELIIRRAVLSEGPLRGVLDLHEQRDADYRFGAPPRAPRISLLGTSLAGGETTTLARELERLTGAGVVDHSGPGVIGDVVGRALVDEARGSVVVVEVNPFPLNEREHLFADWRQYPVVAVSDNALPLFSLPSASLRAAIAKHAGFDAIAGAGLRSVSAGYHLGRSVQGGIRVRLRRLFVGKDAPPNRPTAARRLAITRANFQRKNFERGIDAEVLRTFREHAKSRSPLRIVVYFPPLHGRYVRDAVGSDSQFWDQYSEWRREVAQAFETAGVPVFDYTDFFAERHELFLDYGHLHDTAFPALAGRLASDLRTRGIIP